MEFQRHEVKQSCLYPSLVEANRAKDTLIDRGWPNVSLHKKTDLGRGAAPGWFLVATDPETATIQVFAKRDLVGEGVQRILSRTRR